MASPYRWIVLVHVLAIFVFLLLHGATLAITYLLRRERQRDRVIALLELSRETFDSRGALGRVFWIDFLVVVASGFALMVIGGWWHSAWPYLSAAVLVAIFFSMTELGRLPMNQLRRAVGLPWIRGRGGPNWQPPEPHDQAAMELAVARLHPGALTAIGVGGFAVLLWLMMFKPF